MAVLHVGDVVSIRGTGAMVHVPYVAPGFSFGPLEMLYPAKVGDRVIVGQLEGAIEDLVVLGRVDAFISPYTYIFYFETVAERNAVFDGTPMDMSSPTFAWVDDDLKLYVWTDETNAWRQVSWDEARIAAIEAVNTAQASAISTNTSNISTNTSGIASLVTRATNLEALSVTDSTHIDLTLSGASWPKTLTADLIADTVPIGYLSDVNVPGTPNTGETLRWNGSQFTNAKLAVADLSTVSGSPSAGDVLRYDGTNWVANQSPKRVQATDTNTGTYTGGAYATSITGVSALTTTFVAQSTSCEITVAAHTANSGATGPFDFFMAFQVTGSGFGGYGPNDADAARMQSTVNNGGTSEKTTVVTGLTPGTTYTVTAAHRVSGSTGQWSYRRIIVRY